MLYYLLASYLCHNTPISNIYNFYHFCVTHTIIKTWEINYNTSIHHELLFMFYVLTHTQSYINIFFYDTFILSSFGHHTIRFPFVLYGGMYFVERSAEHKLVGRYKENSLFSFTIIHFSYVVFSEYLRHIYN